jgi:FAD/FMN-containing dehydrogenase
MTGGKDSYERTWQRALFAADAAGATLSHHHGVGRLKAPFLARELGGIHQVLFDCKRQWDPEGRLNPGVLGLPGDVEVAEPHRRVAGIDGTNGLWTGGAELPVGLVEAQVRPLGWTLGVHPASEPSVLQWLRDDLVTATATKMRSARARLVAVEGVLSGDGAVPFGTRVTPRSASGPNLLPRLLDSDAEIEQVTLRLVRRPQRWLHLWSVDVDAMAELRGVLRADFEPWACKLEAGRFDLWFAYDTPAERSAIDALQWSGSRAEAAGVLNASSVTSPNEHEPDERLHGARWQPWSRLHGEALIGLDACGGWMPGAR